MLVGLGIQIYLTFIQPEREEQIEEKNKIEEIQAATEFNCAFLINVDSLVSEDVIEKPILNRFVISVYYENSAFIRQRYGKDTWFSIRNSIIKLESANRLLDMVQQVNIQGISIPSSRTNEFTRKYKQQMVDLSQEARALLCIESFIKKLKK